MCCYLCSACVLFITLRSPLKDDIAWLLYVARRWMAGRELYIDLIEVNPPLIVWISAVPLQIARWLDVGSQFVAMPVFMAGVLGCAWWAARPVARTGRHIRQRLPVFAAIGTSLLILPAADLGQREHLLVAAFLPYLVLFAASLEGKPAPVVASLVAGVLAGLGCALKPRYVAVFAVLECLALTRGVRPWRVMPLAAGATLAGYAGSGRTALSRLSAPRRADGAGAVRRDRRAVPEPAGRQRFAAVGEAVAVALLWLRRRTLTDYGLMLTLLVFAATSTVICFVDGKDWYYHRLPATVATVLALLLWSVAELTQRRGRLRWPLSWRASPSRCSARLRFSGWNPTQSEAVEPQQTTVERLEQILRTEHARTYIAFSEWIALGFPVVNETGVTWASRFDSMWALKGEIWRARFDPAADREWPIARWVAHDFIAGCPDIAVVDTRETTKYISVLSAADSAFARAWSRYRPIASFNGLVVYRRGRAGCLDVWVAAEATPTIGPVTKPPIDIR